MSDNIFQDRNTVSGMPLFEFLEWAEASNHVLSGSDVQLSPLYGVLALPPVQRTALWTPKQVVDLWDSLFRGLPIGSFFLVQRSGQSQGHGMESTAQMTPIKQGGFDLLDGQQRTRAMLLGLMGPTLEQRCLWIDLDPAAKSPHIRIHLTSASQPFGYQPENGQKLPLGDRRKARDRLKNATAEKPLPKRSNGRGGERCAYDHELFDLFLRSDNPPHAPEQLRPFKASALTYPLHLVLGKWLAGSKNGGQGLEALREFFLPRDGSDPRMDGRVMQLDAAFRRVDAAQVALLKVDPSTFEGGAERAHENLLMLFDRIGAGGTPLSSEERLFSIYKHHEPSVYNLVLKIYLKVGRVLPPTKIVVSALRIANARTHEKYHQGNVVPDVTTFAREMASSAQTSATDGRTKSLKHELDELLPSDPDRGDGTLAPCFTSLFDLLYHGEDHKLGLPRVMLTTLSPSLVQVLLLWVLLVREATGSDEALRASRNDAVRFVMFWRLCVQDEDKASTRCFEMLRSTTAAVGLALPDLYGDLVTREYVLLLATPDEMEGCNRHDPSPDWLGWEDRFPKNGQATVDLYRTWWQSRERFLLWLQRSYLAKRFEDFDPASGREDDVPYELDHMCPASDWGRNWQPFKTALQSANCLTADEVESMRWARSVLGNAIGNFRLVDASTNEGDGDDDIETKMPFVGNDGDPLECERETMTEVAFNSKHRAIWRKASGSDKGVHGGLKQWNAERLLAFQQAVEQRTFWLYRCFYDELGFECWTAAATKAD